MPVDPVPPGTVLLHIGPQKTGSTAIQVAAKSAVDELAAHGTHYVTGMRHRPAAPGWALGLAGRPSGQPRPDFGLWETFAARVADSTADRVFVSNEDFSRATPDQIGRIVGDLGGDRIHVVLGARRFDRFLPSQWQERVKAGETRAYDEWLAVVLDRDSEEQSWERHNVWRSHDLQQLVARWSSYVDRSRIHVVVLDEGDRRQLPETFERLLDLPEETLRPVTGRSNRGLTWGECEMFRGINEAIADRGWSKDIRRRLMRGHVFPELRQRAPSGGPQSPPLPHWAAGTLRSLGADRVEWLATSGVDVIGDLDRLRVPDDLATAAEPYPRPEIPRRAVGDLVTALMAGILVAEGEEEAVTRVGEAEGGQAE
jgi:hypothetical protein